MRPSRRRLRRSRPLLGTFVEIELRGRASESRLHAWIGRGFAEVERVERLMSLHRPDSDISRLNRARPGARVRVDPLTARVLRAARELHAASNGAFDIRREAADRLPRESCDFHPNVRSELPAGWQHGVSGHTMLPGRTSPAGGIAVEGQAPRARKTGAWTIDLGGIAKGFAVDRAVDCLRRAKGLSGVVNAGGDLRAFGRAVQASIRVPGRPPRLHPFRLAEAAATSSTGLRKDVTHHSGEGAVLGGRTVTVLARKCLWADALTKVVLAADSATAGRCLARFGAKAVLLTRRRRRLLLGADGAKAWAA